MQELNFLDGEKEDKVFIPDNITEITILQYETLIEIENEEKGDDAGEILIRVYGVDEDLVNDTSIESLNNWLNYHKQMITQFENIRERIDEELKEMADGIIITHDIPLTSKTDLNDVKYGVWKNFEKVIDAFGENDFTKLIRYTMAVFMESDDEEYNALDFDGKARQYEDVSFFDGYKYFTFFLTNSKLYANFINLSSAVQSMREFTPEQGSKSLTSVGEVSRISSNLQNTKESLDQSTEDETTS